MGVRETMFNAICSRDKNQKLITADEAYSKVFRHEDWGFFQARDGWICPECKQPVFLKGPHERIGKGFSFVVQAHFCHHSAAAAANCALFQPGGKAGPAKADAIDADRRQSLKRFFSEAPKTADFIADLLRRDEETLHEAASDIGFRRHDHLQSAKSIDISRGYADLTARSIHDRLSQVDSFLAGVFALGEDHRRKVRGGFLAIKGRKNRLRSMFIAFGRNRKKYFQLLDEAGLMQDHDVAASRLVSQAATEIESLQHEDGSTHHGMALKLLDNVLLKLDLAEPNEWSSNFLQYLHALPILGNSLQGFELLNSTPLQRAVKQAKAGEKLSRNPPTRKIPSPPVRITRKGLLIETKVIDKLVSEGSKRNGFTTFLKPNPSVSENHYIAIPGDQCILLTSFFHTNGVKGGRTRPIEKSGIENDKELPKMLWGDQILLPRDCDLGNSIFIKKKNLMILKNAIEAHFGSSCYIHKGGLHYRRLTSGLRISLKRP